MLIFHSNHCKTKCRLKLTTTRGPVLHIGHQQGAWSAKFIQLAEPSNPRDARWKYQVKLVFRFMPQCSFSWISGLFRFLRIIPTNTSFKQQWATSKKNNWSLHEVYNAESFPVRLGMCGILSLNPPSVPNIWKLGARFKLLQANIVETQVRVYMVIIHTLNS